MLTDMGNYFFILSRCCKTNTSLHVFKFYTIILNFFKYWYHLLSITITSASNKHQFSFTTKHIDETLKKEKKNKKESSQSNPILIKTCYATLRHIAGL